MAAGSLAALLPPPAVAQGCGIAFPWAPPGCCCWGWAVSRVIAWRCSPRSRFFCGVSLNSPVGCVARYTISGCTT